MAERQPGGSDETPGVPRPEESGRGPVSDQRPLEQKKLPRLERGTDLSRILAFTDGVFAIAITLLVLQIEVPSGAGSAGELLDRLGEESPNLIAYGISFAVIGSLWIKNHRFMRTVREFDLGLMWLLLLYLGLMVLIPFLSQLIGDYGEYPVAVMFYIGDMVLLVGASALMMRHAVRRGLVRPEYAWDVAISVRSALFTGFIFLLSVPLVFVVGTWALMFWFVLALDPFQRRRDRAYTA